MQQSTAANNRIKKSTEDTFRKTVKGYASVTTSSSNVGFYKSSSHYALLPVWILNTTWNNQKFMFAMNGQTGKFVGNLPTDKKLFWKWFFRVFAISGAAASLLMTLLTMMR